VSAAVAVVGAGAWGRNHVRTFQQLGSLAGVVESSKLLRERLRTEFPGVPVWTSLEPALERAEGIVIATPAPTHADLAAQALEAGRGVLVEKPMTLDTAHAEHLVALAQARSRPLMVGHTLLYQPAIQELKRQLDAGVVGPVLRVNQQRLKHGRVRSAENVLWSFAPHDLAVLLYLMGGPPLEVRATGAAFLQPGIADDVHLELAFAGGRSAHVHVSWYWPETRRGLQVLGAAGMLSHEEADQSLTLHRRHLKGGAEDPLAPADLGSVLVYLGQGQALLREDQHFLDCLDSGEPPLSDGRSGVEVIRVLAEADAQLNSIRKEHP
jgi:predicted dehydrogenase